VPPAPGRWIKPAVRPVKGYAAWADAKVLSNQKTILANQATIKVRPRSRRGFVQPIRVILAYHSLLQSPPEGGNHIGQLVWDPEAVEEGTRPGRAAVVRIECDPGGFRWCLSRNGETGTQTPQDVREVPSENRSRTESTLG